ncbi:hypothetical protein DdX_15823 [Ditylenchus destructor]|uniref:Ubiquitin-like domain-containing protein n=1 Tax=Ditylenchus destructor TaxID=166010 RepID=A0AAD4MQP1_9BILA|nr:hypothetical protein DdX_15823 [Ditylenchus destructor]
MSHALRGGKVAVSPTAISVGSTIGTKVSSRDTSSTTSGATRGRSTKKRRLSRPRRVLSSSVSSRSTIASRGVSFFRVTLKQDDKVPRSRRSKASPVSNHSSPMNPRVLIQSFETEKRIEYFLLPSVTVQEVIEEAHLLMADIVSGEQEFLLLNGKIMKNHLPIATYAIPDGTRLCIISLNTMRYINAKMEENEDKHASRFKVHQDSHVLHQINKSFNDLHMSSQDCDEARKHDSRSLHDGFVSRLDPVKKFHEISGRIKMECNRILKKDYNGNLNFAQCLSESSSKTIKSKSQDQSSSEHSLGMHKKKVTLCGVRHLSETDCKAQGMCQKSPGSDSAQSNNVPSASSSTSTSHCATSSETQASSSHRFVKRKQTSGRVARLLSKASHSFGTNSESGSNTNCTGTEIPNGSQPEENSRRNSSSSLLGTATPKQLRVFVQNYGTERKVEVFLLPYISVRTVIRQAHMLMGESTRQGREYLLLHGEIMKDYLPISMYYIEEGAILCIISASMLHMVNAAMTDAPFKQVKGFHDQRRTHFDMTQSETNTNFTGNESAGGTRVNTRGASKRISFSPSIVHSREHSQDRYMLYETAVEVHRERDIGEMTNSQFELNRFENESREIAKGQNRESEGFVNIPGRNLNASCDVCDTFFDSKNEREYRERDRSPESILKLLAAEYCAATGEELDFGILNTETEEETGSEYATIRDEVENEDHAQKYYVLHYD